jgi:hypothetical protein
MWLRFKLNWYRSATIVWNGISALFWCAISASELLAAPEFKAELAQVFDVQTVAAIGIVLTLGSIVSRMRTLGR